MTKYDPREVAVALAYRSGESAPQVIAKGRGLIAETIISEARTRVPVDAGGSGSAYSAATLSGGRGIARMAL